MAQPLASAERELSAFVTAIHLPGVVLDPTSVETNIVIFELKGSVDPKRALATLLARGVRMGAMGPRTVRAVTHLDVSPPQIERALEAAAYALSEARR